MADEIILKGKTKFLKPIITQLLAMNQLLEQKDVGIIYGQPSTEFQEENRAYKPEIQLQFVEDSDDVLPGYYPARGRISFRIMGETSNTISKAEATRYGQLIKETFAANGGYVWVKGKELYCYADWSKGYQLQILGRSSERTKELITKVLSIQGHIPDWKNLSLKKNDAELEKYPYTPPNQVILGEVVKGIRYRPNVECRFKYAIMHVHGLAKPLTLYGDNKNKKEALVK